MRKIKVKTPAKINLTLEVLNRREDGFHNIQSIMQTISLYDYLTFEVSENNGIFDFKGVPYVGKPAFEISAGHLLQVLTGYHSLDEIKNEIQVFDEMKFEEINALLIKQNCYIIDEY